MKFAAKYEILETFTRGSVETFAARKVATDEVVLVHIFECQEQQPNQPTVQWIMESFRAIAPAPCARVVETGRYDETSYGYLVTRLPEKPALQAWIQSYEARQQTGDEVVVPPVRAPALPLHETATPEAGPAPAAEAATRVFGTTAPPERPEGITQEFEALRSELESPVADQTPSALHVDHTDAGGISAQFRAMGFETAAKPGDAETPGDFTRRFSMQVEEKAKSTSALSDKTPRPVVPTEERRGPVGMPQRTPARDTRIQQPPASAGAETPSGMLRRIVLPPTDSAITRGPEHSVQSGSTPKPAPTSVSGKAGEPGTGEFTKFFRGPFDGERSTETPDLSGAVAKEEKDTGDFTKVFGRPKDNASGQLPRLPGSPGYKSTTAASDAGSFTKLFESQEVPKKTSGVYESDVPFRDRSEFRSGEFPAAKQQPGPKPGPRPGPISAETPAPMIPLGDRKGVSDPELPFSSRSERDAATRVFSAEREPAPDLSTLPAGPSEYTRVISGGLKKYGLSEEPGAEPQTSAAHAALPSVPPPTPAVPAIPQFPPVGGQPQMPAPPPPVLPAGPAQPPGPVATKAAGAPWTMIIILNILFLLALALVLYFVFRH
jgi:hypothetical protein